MSWEPREPGTKLVKTKQTVINGASWTLEECANVKTLKQLRKENKTPNPGEAPKGFISKMKPLKNLRSDQGLLKLWDGMKQKQRENVEECVNFTGP